MCDERHVAVTALALPSETVPGQWRQHDYDACRAMRSNSKRTASVPRIPRLLSTHQRYVESASRELLVESRDRAGSARGGDAVGRHAVAESEYRVIRNIDVDESGGSRAACASGCRCGHHARRPSRTRHATRATVRRDIETRVRLAHIARRPTGSACLRITCRHRPQPLVITLLAVTRGAPSRPAVGEDEAHLLQSYRTLAVVVKLERVDQTAPALALTSVTRGDDISVR